MKRVLKLSTLVAVVALYVSCEESYKPDIQPTNPPVVEENPNDISQFIWKGLNTYYLWVDEVKALNLQKESEPWKRYLNGYKENYKDLFGSLLHKVPDEEGRATVDRWSWFIEDYVKQKEAFEGISQSFGFEYKLSLNHQYNDGVCGYVTYIMPDSPASRAGLKRGDVFVSINGEKLDLKNYKKLLYANTSYRLGLADGSSKLEGNKIKVHMKPNGKELTVSKVKYTENPILMAKKIEVGTKKVGYMVYNSFIGTEQFTKAMNDSIGKLKSEGITDFILDLRYNGGGSVYAAILLGSILDGKHTGQVFSESRYNKAIQSYYVNNNRADELKDLFVDRITKKVNGENETVAKLNSLRLSRVFVLVSGSSASASELVINGLKPYMDVILIGTRTHGKYVGSITVYDYIDNKRTKNPKHKFAMQPIVLKIANAEGVTDYKNGFAPDYRRHELLYLGDIKPLGDPNEPYLAAALGIIKGEGVSKEDPRAGIATKAVGSIGLDFLFDSKDMKPFSKEMYDERIEVDHLNRLHK